MADASPNRILAPRQARILTPSQAREEARRIAHAKRERSRGMVGMEHPGRRVGKPHGTYVTDEAEMKKCVILCWRCSHKFDPAKYHYYLTKEFRVQGRCDGCKEHTQDVKFFIHESLLGRKHGQCWTPR